MGRDGHGRRQAPARLRLPRPDHLLPAAGAECLLIEPTETETKEELDAFVDAMVRIREEVERDPELVKTAPHSLVVSRLDDVKAARELDLVQKT